MTATASTKLQVNFKTSSGTLINAYADNPDELVNELSALESLAGTIAAVESILLGVSAVGNIAAPPSQIPNAQAPNQGWNNNPAPVQPGGFAQHEQQAPAHDPWAQATQGPPPAWAGQQQQQQPQAQGGRQCAHGAMTFKQGVSKTTGKAWKAYFCPTPKGTPGQCDPEFLR